MQTLGSRLDRVEELGFRRDVFPLRVFGHNIVILENDAYIAEDGRLFLHMSLACKNCETSSILRGRLPEGVEDISGVVALSKLALFGRFKYFDCV